MTSSKAGLLVIKTQKYQKNLKNLNKVPRRCPIHLSLKKKLSGRPSKTSLVSTSLIVSQEKTATTYSSPNFSPKMVVLNFSANFENAKYCPPNFLANLRTIGLLPTNGSQNGPKNEKIIAFTFHFINDERKERGFTWWKVFRLFHLLSNVDQKEDDEADAEKEHFGRVTLTMVFNRLTVTLIEVQEEVCLSIKNKRKYNFWQHPSS